MDHTCLHLGRTLGGSLEIIWCTYNWTWVILVQGKHYTIHISSDQHHIFKKHNPTCHFILYEMKSLSCRVNCATVSFCILHVVENNKVNTIVSKCIKFVSIRTNKLKLKVEKQKTYLSLNRYNFYKFKEHNFWHKVGKIPSESLRVSFEFLKCICLYNISCLRILEIVFSSDLKEKLFSKNCSIFQLWHSKDNLMIYYFAIFELLLITNLLIISKSETIIEFNVIHFCFVVSGIE